MKRSNQWNWFVWGKHPGVEDFICAGTQTPLFQRFTKWVDNGFARIGMDLKSRAMHCSWRFWTKGASEDVVCGLVRNSCDSYGRSFPLLYLGTGQLKDWTHNCSLLPFAFESTWKGFEYVAAARYHSVGRLNETLQLIEPPAPDWRQYQQRIHNATNLSTVANFDEKVEGQKRLYKIACELPEDLPHDLNFCSRVMVRGKLTTPMAVFIGEIEAQIAVAIIDQVLNPADFAWLWTLKENSDTLH